MHASQWWVEHSLAERLLDRHGSLWFVVVLALLVAGPSFGDLLSNGDFDTNLDGWSVLGPGTATWNMEDANSAPGSGSALVVGVPAPGLTFLRQCNPVVGGSDYSAAADQFLFEGGQVGQADVFVDAYDGANCSGTWLGRPLSNQNTTDTGTWSHFESEFQMPENAVSAYFSVAVADNSSRFDNLWLQDLESLPEPDYSLCTELSPVPDPACSVGIVFVPTSTYPSVGDGSLFAEDVDSFIATFLNNPLYGGFASSFGFYRVDRLDPSDFCQPSGTCAENHTDWLASHCRDIDRGANDQVVVLFNGSSFIAYADRQEGEVWIGSGAEAVFAHEFSHSFAKLGDEYDRPPFSVGIPPPPNCASLDPGSTCVDKWGDLIAAGEAGCFENCGNANWFRPTLSGCIMRSVDSSSFCPVCEREATGQIEAVSGAPVCSSLFADDFESGDTTAWSDTVP